MTHHDIKINDCLTIFSRETQEGAHTADDIVQIIYGDLSPSLVRHAKSNVLLHLKKLHNEGKLPSEFRVLL